MGESRVIHRREGASVHLDLWSFICKWEPLMSNCWGSWGRCASQVSLWASCFLTNVWVSCWSAHSWDPVTRIPGLAWPGMHLVCFQAFWEDLVPDEMRTTEQPCWIEIILFWVGSGGASLITFSSHLHLSGQSSVLSSPATFKTKPLTPTSQPDSVI